jgi:hypothetical protein
MSASIQELPVELQKFIQAKMAVLNEELIIDGKTMTVAQVAQGYRNEKTKTTIFAVLAVIAVAMLAFTSSWFTTHPKETVVFVAPAK